MEKVIEQGAYCLGDDGSFVIRDYHRTKPFSSFLPGVAGLWGVPMWVYLVNRGQAVACFGTEDKDHAILPFESANLHHRRVATEGFRTFLRLEGCYYEPFRSRQDDFEVHNRLEIRGNSLVLVETNADLGLVVRVEMACATGRSFPALCRRVQLRDLSGSDRQVELLDGLGRILPFYIPAELHQTMPFISEGYLQVTGLEANLPILRNKAQSSDTPETEFVREGHFFFGLDETAGDGALLPAIVDPRRVFGDYVDWHRPHAFLAAGDFDPSGPQDTCALSPSAMVHWTGLLPAGSRQAIRLTIGRARSQAEARDIPPRVCRPAWFDENLSAAEGEIRRIADRMFLHSGRRELDLYAGRTFVDNTLRGGLPLSLGTGPDRKVFHVFSRRHGDLERDYNFFQLDATCFSQGNGAFRDVNQNRRNDVWINPDVGDENVRFFFNLLQLDGFNPMQVKGARFRIVDRPGLEALLGEAFAPAEREVVSQALGDTFTPGRLFETLICSGIEPRIDRATLLDRLIDLSEKVASAEFEAGYWCDHWFYNFDLLESYLAIFPDRLEGLLLGRQQYTYWDPDIQVLPRSEKHVIYKPGQIKQLDAIRRDPEKAALIASRTSLPRQVRTQAGRGEIYRTNLLEKLVCLLANKAASFSPSGMGIEMDGGRPGWNDSVNGLPGLFGASVSEVIQLKRAAVLTRRLAVLAGVTDDYAQDMPVEIVRLVEAVQAALNARLADESDRADHEFWDAANVAKETYRREVRMGLDGATAPVSWSRIRGLLDAIQARAQISLDASVDPDTGLPVTYVIHEPTEYTPLVDPAGRARTNARGMELVEIQAFHAHRFPLFLEGPLHALRIEEDPVRAAGLDQAVRTSCLRDEKLDMYVAGDSVAEEHRDLGRIYAWPPGWFENENVFTHAEHKYLLSQLRAGLAEEFYKDLQTCMVCFQDVERFGRSPIENISFIVSSRHPRPDYHGRGFLPRTSGTTSEVLNLLLWMAFGEQPFDVVDGRLRFAPRPVLAAWLFSQQPARREWTDPDGRQRTLGFEAGSFAACLFGSTIVAYRNPKGRATFGPEAVEPVCMTLTRPEGTSQTFEAGFVDGSLAEEIRNRTFRRIDVELG